MNPSDYARINEIVGRALELDEAERSRFIREQCGAEADLLREVEALLEVDVGDSFLAGSAEDSLPHEADLIGTRIGRIDIVELVAAGGTSEIYRGVDELLERPVAVKVLKSASWAGEAQRASFLAEAKVLSSVAHPNICTVHDFFRDTARDVLVLELIEGQTLRERLEEGTVQEPLDVAVQVARALTFAHERGIAHRDLKPENVMFSGRDQVKVVDFGLARLTEVAGVLPAEGGPAASPVMTTVAGTPGYIAPEQARGESATTASDLWSFGLVFIELLTGERPFSKSASSAELMVRARQGEAAIPAGLGSHESALARRLLSPEPEDRPSAREALVELERLRERPMRLRRAALACAAAALATFGIAKYTLDLRAEREVAIEARADAEGLVAYMLEDLAVSLSEFDRIDLMESVARRALDYYGDLEPSEIASLQGRPVLALQTIAGILDRQGDVDGAIETYRLVVSALETAHQKDPSDDLVSYRLGMAYGKLGDTQQVAGLVDAATSSFERVIAVAETLTSGLEPGAGPEVSPTGAQRWSLLLEANYFLLDTRLRQGEARTVSESLPPLLEVAQQTSDRTGEGSALANLIYLDCVAQIDSGGARGVAACERSLAVDRANYESDTNNFNALGIYANGHIPLSDALLREGDAARSLVVADEGEELLSRVIERNPDDAMFHNNRVAMLLARARALGRLSRDDERQQTLEECLAITSDLVAAGDQTVFLNNRFATLVYLGRLDEARPLADELWKRGFRRPEFVALCTEHGLCDA